MRIGKLLKRMMAILVVFVLVVSTAACGTTEKSGEEKTAIAEQSTAAVQETTAAEKPKTPVTLKIFGPKSGVSSPAGVQDDPIAKEIERATGVTIDIDLAYSEEKFLAMMASGDLPDIIMSINDKLKTHIEGNQVIELDKLIETNGPDIAKNASKQLELSRQIYSNGTGKLYFLPGNLDPGATPFFMQVPFIRWDYYKEMGYPKVTNLDELANVLIEMQKKHPTTADGKKMYASGFSLEWGIWQVSIPAGLFFGLYDANDSTALNIADNSIVGPFDPQSPLIQGAKFYNKLHRAGVLDPDSMTQKYNDWAQKVTDNKMLCQFFSWTFGTTNSVFAKAGEEKGYLPIAPPEGVTTYGNDATPFGDVGKKWAITTNCKTPDRAMDLLNYFYSYEGCRTLQSGVKGQLYDLVDGKMKLMPGVEQDMVTDPDFNLKNGIGKYNKMVGLGGNNLDENGQALYILGDPSAKSDNNVPLTPLEKEFASYYGISNATGFNNIEEQIFEKRAYKNISVDHTYDILIDPVSEDLVRIREKGRVLFEKYLTQMIMAKDDNTFDSLKAKLFDELKAAGIEQYVDWKTAQFEAAKDKYSKLK